MEGGGQASAQRRRRLRRRGGDVDRPPQRVVVQGGGGGGLRLPRSGGETRCASSSTPSSLRVARGPCVQYGSKEAECLGESKMASE